MKTLILTAFHQRPIVSEIFLMSMGRIKQKADIQVCAVVSDDENMALCEKYKVNYCTSANYPVGSKWNIGLESVLYYKFDHLCIMGSDDIAATEVFTILYDENKHKDYFGYQSAYFLSPQHSEAKKFTYQTNKLIGSCRFISKPLLERVAWQVRVIAEVDFEMYKKHQAYYMSIRKAEYLKSLKYISIVSEPKIRLWYDNIDKGLDMSLELTMMNEGYYGEAIKTYNPLVTAIKTDNIWNYAHVKGEVVPTGDTMMFMSEEEKTYLYALGVRKELTLESIFLQS